ncbi:MAG: cohesin domain-containing protein, partial [Bacteroidota bacterium]
MKKYIAILTLIFALGPFHANSQQFQTNPLTIDQFDTIFFDLSAASVVGSTVEFPVYYKSDDQVVALDFNFKYNHNKLDYDTIVKLANYLDVLSFYNTNDSTVRLTSYTNTLFYPNDSVLFKVKFTVLQPGPLCNGDIFAVNSLLNGDICT